MALVAAILEDAGRDREEWEAERSFAWISRYRRLNTIFDRTKEHLVAFVEIAFVSILARRLKRFEIDEVSA